MMMRIINPLHMIFLPGNLHLMRKTEYKKPEHFLDFGEVSETFVGADENALDYIVAMTSATASRQMQLKAVIRQCRNAPGFKGFYIKRKQYKLDLNSMKLISDYNEY